MHSSIPDGRTSYPLIALSGHSNRIGECGKADMPFCTAKADFDILHSRLKANRFQIGKAVHTKAVLRDLHASKSALPAKPQPRTFAGGVSREAPAPADS